MVTVIQFKFNEAWEATETCRGEGGRGGVGGAGGGTGGGGGEGGKRYRCEHFTLQKIDCKKGQKTYAKAELSTSPFTHPLAACGPLCTTPINLSTCLPVYLRVCAVLCIRVWDCTRNGPLFLLVCRYTCKTIGFYLAHPSATSSPVTLPCSPVLLLLIPACLLTTMYAPLLFAHLSS